MNAIRKEKGFTLVEILIVTIIMAILSLGIFEFFNFQTSAFNVEDQISQMTHTGQASVDIMDRDLQMVNYFLIAQKGDNEGDRFNPANYVNGIIEFEGDIDGNGIDDTVHYELNAAENILYRGVIKDSTPGNATFPDDFAVDKVSKNVETLNYIFYEQNGADITQITGGGVDNDSDTIKEAVSDQAHRDDIRGIEVVLVVRSDKPKMLKPNASFVSDNPFTDPVENDGYIRRVFRTRIESRTLSFQALTSEATGESPCGTLIMTVSPQAVATCEDDGNVIEVQVTTLAPTTTSEKLPSIYGDVKLVAKYTTSGALSHCADAACTSPDPDTDPPRFYKYDTYTTEDDTIPSADRDTSTGTGIRYLKVDADTKGDAVEVYATWITPEGMFECPTSKQLDQGPIKVTVKAGKAAELVSPGASPNFIKACRGSGGSCAAAGASMVSTILTDKCSNVLSGKDVTFSVNTDGSDGAFDEANTIFSFTGSTSAGGLAQASLLYSPDAVGDGVAVVNLLASDSTTTPPTTVSDSVNIEVRPCDIPFEMVMIEPLPGQSDIGARDLNTQNCDGNEYLIKFDVQDACQNHMPGLAANIEAYLKDKNGLVDNGGWNGTLDQIIEVPNSGSVQGYYKLKYTVPSSNCYLTDPWSIDVKYLGIPDGTQTNSFTFNGHPIACPDPIIGLQIENDTELPTYFGADSGVAEIGMELGCPTPGDTSDDVAVRGNINAACLQNIPDNARVIFEVNNPNDGNSTYAEFDESGSFIHNKAVVPGVDATAVTYLNSGSIRLDPNYMTGGYEVLDQRLEIKATMCIPGGGIEATLKTTDTDVQCNPEDIEYVADPVYLYLGPSKAGFTDPNTDNYIAGSIGLFAPFDTQLINMDMVPGQLPCSIDPLGWGLYALGLAESPGSGCTIPLLEMPLGITSTNTAYLEVKDCDRNVTSGVDTITVNAYSEPLAYGSNQIKGQIVGNGRYNMSDEETFTLIETGPETGIFKGTIDYRYPSIVPEPSYMTPTRPSEYYSYPDILVGSPGILDVTYGNTVLFKYLEDVTNDGSFEDEALVEAVAQGVRFIVPTDQSGELLPWWGGHYELSPEADSANITNSTGFADGFGQLPDACTYNSLSFWPWNSISCSRHTVMPAIYIPEYSSTYGDTNSGQIIEARISGVFDLTGTATDDGDGQDYFQLKEMSIDGTPTNNGIFRIDSGSNISLYKYLDQPYIFVTNDSMNGGVNVEPGTGSNVDISFGMDQTPNILLIQFDQDAGASALTEADNQLVVFVVDVDAPKLTIDSVNGFTDQGARVDTSFSGISTTEIRIEGSIDDGYGDGIMEIQVSLDGGASYTETAMIDYANYPPTNWYIDIPVAFLASDGLYTIQARAADYRANVGYSNTFDFILDNVADSVDFIQPADGVQVCGEVTFEVDVSSIYLYPTTDELSLKISLWNGFSDMAILIDETVAYGSTYTYTVSAYDAPFTPAMYAFYQARVVVDDMGGDTGYGPFEDFVGFYVDNYPPGPYISSPWAGAIVQSNVQLYMYGDDSCGVRPEDITVEVYNTSDPFNSLVDNPVLFNCLSPSPFDPVNDLCTVGDYILNIDTDGDIDPVTANVNSCNLTTNYFPDGNTTVYETIVDAGIDPTTASATRNFYIDNAPIVAAPVVNFNTSDCTGSNDPACMTIDFAAADCDGVAPGNVKARIWNDMDWWYEPLYSDNIDPSFFKTIPGAECSNSAGGSEIQCSLAANTNDPLYCMGGWSWEPNALYDGWYRVEAMADDMEPAIAGACDPTFFGTINDCGISPSTYFMINNVPQWVNVRWVKYDFMIGDFVPITQPHLNDWAYLEVIVSDCDPPNGLHPDPGPYVDMQIVDTVSGMTYPMNWQWLWSWTGAEYRWIGEWYTYDQVPMNQSSTNLGQNFEVQLTAMDGTPPDATTTIPAPPGGVNNSSCSVPMTPTMVQQTTSTYQINGTIVNPMGVPVNNIVYEIYVEYYDSFSGMWFDQFNYPPVKGTSYRFKGVDGVIRLNYTLPSVPSPGTGVSFYLRIVEDPGLDPGNITKSTCINVDDPGMPWDYTMYWYMNF